MSAGPGQCPGADFPFEQELVGMQRPDLPFTEQVPYVQHHQILEIGNVMKVGKDGPEYQLTQDNDRLDSCRYCCCMRL